MLKNLIWQMFKNTGNIEYFMQYRDVSEKKPDYKTEAGSETVLMVNMRTSKQGIGHPGSRSRRLRKILTVISDETCENLGVAKGSGGAGIAILPERRFYPIVIGFCIKGKIHTFSIPVKYCIPFMKSGRI